MNPVTLLDFAKAYFTDKSVTNMMYAFGILLVAVVFVIFLSMAYQGYKDAKLLYASFPTPENADKIKSAYNSLLAWGIPGAIILTISLIFFGRGVYFSWQSSRNNVKDFPIQRLVDLAKENSELGRNLMNQLPAEEFKMYQLKQEQIQKMLNPSPTPEQAPLIPKQE